MNLKKYFLAAFLVFISFILIDFIFDSFILMRINITLKNIWRPHMIFWLEPVLYMASALFFVLIFALANKGNGLSEGILYGFLIGLLISGIQSFKQYALYSIPIILAIFWFIEGLIQYTIAGILTALIAQPKK